MPVEVKLPDLGENVDSGDVIKVLVQVGDTIQVDDPLIELETGKATVEVPSSAAGKIVSIDVKNGDQIKVGQTLVTLDGEVPVAKGASDTPNTSDRSDTPDTADESDKSDRSEKPQAESAPSLPVAATAAPATSPGDRRAVPASPSVRQFAREVGVDVTQVSGSGAGGRISVEDVKRFARQRPGTGAATPASVQALPDFTKYGPVKCEAMTTIRQMTAQQLSLAWSTVPMVTHHEDADVTSLESLRKRFASRVEEAGGKLTVTSILLKVVAAALRKFPKFNASIDVARREVIFKDYVNVGVAVDTQRGLLVPVVRDVDGKGILQLAVELGALAVKARDGKLLPDDLAGGNFTITNLGGLGTHHFTPIINVPEVAILGVGRAEWRPVVVDGEIKTRLRMPLSLTYDHRLIDGADAARFATWLVEALEQPFVLSLEG